MKRTALRFPVRQGGALLLALLFWALPVLQATASTAFPLPTATLSITPVHYFAMEGPPLSAGVRVTVPMPLPLPVDVYVGARLPNGTFASWVQGANESILVTQSTPIPFMKSFLLETDVHWDFRYVFSGTEPLGFYLAYAILVFSGRDPLDARNWLAVSTVPFTFNP